MSRTATVLSILLLFSGCQQLQTDYAAYRGESINGVRVFADMIRETGVQVDAWPGVGEFLHDDYDLVIIFEDNYGPLSQDQIENLQEYFEFGYAVEFVYILRDIDCEATYWKAIEKTFYAQGNETKANKAASLALSAQSHMKSSAKSYYTLSEMSGIVGVTKTRAEIESLGQVQLRGFNADYELEADFRTQPCQWDVYREHEFGELTDVLWKTSNGQPLLGLQVEDNYDLYVLTSGYPLLNGSLIEPENQQLAQELIELLNPVERVAIITSSRVLNLDENEASFWKFLTVFPHPWIVGQLLVFMVLFCLWKFPIFGRPRTIVVSELKRFSTHINALGDLLRRTRQYDYAKKRIHEWKGRQQATHKRGSTS